METFSRLSLRSYLTSQSLLNQPTSSYGQQSDLQSSDSTILPVPSDCQSSDGEPSIPEYPDGNPSNPPPHSSYDLQAHTTDFADDISFEEINSEFDQNPKTQ